jgi:DNA polymerase
MKVSFNNCFDLNSEIVKCNKCNISPNRGFGFGNINSKIMFIAQSPGWQPQNKTEDIIPFGLEGSYGNSGKYFIKLLNDFKINKKNIYVTNVVKCPTPNNRPPLEQEENNCIQMMIKEFSIQKPKIIILLGGTAKKYFFNNNDKFIKYINDSCIFDIWHPAFILRDPNKYKQWIYNLKMQIKKRKKDEKDQKSRE